MKFISVFAQMFAAFFSVFALLLIALVASISFLTWSIPDFAMMLDKVLMVSRVLTLVSLVFTLMFMFSRDGKREWRV